MGNKQSFDLAALELALTELGRRAYAADRVVEIAMNRRINTRDVDAVFEKDKTFVKKIATEMAEELGWDEDWLNDGVKGWLSAKDSDPDVKALFRTYPSEEQPGLRVFVAKPEYIFAMKCRAMRIGGVDSSSDIDDIRLLARKIGIKSSDDALALVEKFYPQNVLEPKTRLGLEEIFSALDIQVAGNNSDSSREQ